MVQGLGVGPVQVVEHDQDGCGLGDEREPRGHRLVRPVASVVGRRRGDTARLRGEHAHQFRGHTHQAGQVPDQTRIQRAGVRPGQLLTEVGAQDLRERLERGGDRLVAAAREDCSASGGDARGELGGQATLAHPGLATDGHHVEAVVAVAPGLGEDRELVVATDQTGVAADQTGHGEVGGLPCHRMRLDRGGDGACGIDAAGAGTRAGAVARARAVAGAGAGAGFGRIGAVESPEFRVDVAEHPRRFHSEFLDEHFASPPMCVQRVAVTPASVEGEYELPPAVLL